MIGGDNQSQGWNCIALGSVGRAESKPREPQWVVSSLRLRSAKGSLIGRVAIGLERGPLARGVKKVRALIMINQLNLPPRKITSPPF